MLKADLNVIYTVGFYATGISGKRKATLEKRDALEKQCQNFTFYSVQVHTDNAILSYAYSIFSEVKVFLKICISKHKPDVIFARTFFGHFYNLAGKLFGSKVIREVHASLKDEAEILYKDSAIKKYFSNWIHIIDLSSIKRCDGIIFNNPDLKNHFESKLGTGHVNSTSIYNGSNTEVFKPEPKIDARKALGIARNKLVFVFTGSVSEWHGVEYMLETIKAVNERNEIDFQMYVVGCRQSDYHAKLVEKFDVLPNIIFVDQVPVETAKNYINASDICMLPVAKIRESQGSPLKLYDYIACGKPVITQSDVNGYSDVVNKFNLGISIDFYNASEAADQVINFVKNNNQDFYTLNNRLIAEEKLNWRNVIENWINFTFTIAKI